MRALKPARLLPFTTAVLLTCTALATNLGPDDRQVSETGLPGTAASDAVTPAIAFDPASQHYLAVWSADEIDGEFHIYGRLLSGASGEPLGPAFVISPVGEAGTDHREPAVAFSPAHGVFFVVWASDADVPGAYEVLGRFITPLGVFASSPRRYSSMGTDDADTAFDAVDPDVAWHPVLDAFTVIWSGDDDTGQLVDGRFEVYGQLVDGGTSLETGADDFRISYAVSDDTAGYDMLEPSVAVHPSSDRWFVAFEADPQDDDVHRPEIFMYGCTGDVPDPAAVLLSSMGGSLFDAFTARHPDLAWVPSSGELICVWDGDNGDGVRAVYGQRILLDGTLVGGMISFSAGAGTPHGDLREADHPTIVVNPVTDHWFVAWRGDLDDGVVHFDHEVWARRFNDVGAPVDAAAFALSGMDPSLGPVAGAGRPAVAVNSVHGYKLAVWSGDRDVTPLDEFETFAQGWADDAPSTVDDAPAATPFALHGAAPNPFNPVTKIAWDLPAAAPVTLHVYDAAGRVVRRLLTAAPRSAGRNEQIWDGRDDAGREVAAGVYLYRLETPERRAHGRMALVK
jgi:hypothetical protein